MVQVLAWKQKSSSGCPPEQPCSCDLTYERGICLGDGSKRREEPQVCTCEWEVATFTEDAERVSILVSTSVTSQRKGQPLRQLAQDIRVEVRGPRCWALAC